METEITDIYNLNDDIYKTVYYGTLNDQLYNDDPEPLDWISCYALGFYTYNKPLFSFYNIHYHYMFSKYNGNIVNQTLESISINNKPKYTLDEYDINMNGINYYNSYTNLTLDNLSFSYLSEYILFDENINDNTYKSYLVLLYPTKEKEGKNNIIQFSRDTSRDASISLFFVIKINFNYIL